jgi:hypothetical protein
MLAEMTTGEIVADFIALGCFIVALIALLKKQEVRLDQPLSMELVETLVTKDDFKDHVKENSKVHDDLFAKLGGVDRGARDNNDKQVATLRAELNSTNATMHELKGEMKQLTSQLVLIQQELARR